MTGLRAADATMLPTFRQEAQAWLQGPPGLNHWWCPQHATLGQAVLILLTEVGPSLDGWRVSVFRQGDFLALLQRLNIRLAWAQQPHNPPQVCEQELWILEHAERVSTAHVDVLRRVCLHYPELQIHLAMFSHTEAAPVSLEGVSLHALVPSDQAFSEGEGSDSVEPQAAGRSARLIAAGLILLIAISAGARWWEQQSASDFRADPVEAPAPAKARPEGSPSEAVTVPDASQGAASADREFLPSVSSADADSLTASRRWLFSLPASSLVVVHSQQASLPEAEAFRREQETLANARILRVTRSGQPDRYLVVTGPFRSPERASNYIQRLAWKSTAQAVGRDELLAQVPR